MELERHILCAFDDYAAKKVDSALMHGCIAIEGTARRLYNSRIGRKEYKKLLREYYWVLEPMIGSGLNLEETVWSNIENFEGKRPISNPDFADIIYHIYRCESAHCKPISENFKLLPVSDGRSDWCIGSGLIQIPERVIWALIAVSVFSRANAGISTPGSYYLSWGAESLGIGVTKFPVSQWWGREDDFREFLSNQKLIRVKLDKLERMRSNDGSTNNEQNPKPLNDALPNSHGDDPSVIISW